MRKRLDVFNDALARERQAESDLQSILEKAKEVILDALPDARVIVGGAEAQFQLNQTVLTVRLWLRSHSPIPPDDPMILGGEVIASYDGKAPHRAEYKGPGLLANIVCETQDDSPVWRLYRFSAQGFAGEYPYGTREHPHGFSRTIFANERAKMIRAVTQLWSLSYTTLSPDGIADLMAEALELAPSQ